MSRDTKRDLLSNVRLFAGCSDKELKAIESLLDEVRVRAGRQLINEGQVGTEAYVIVERPRHGDARRRRGGHPGAR